MNEDRIETLKRENIIWIIYVFFAYFGIKANNLEMQDILNNSENNKKQYKSINVIILLIALGIYIYFIDLTYKRYRKSGRLVDGLQALGATLVLIAGFLFLYAEIHGDDVVPNEL